jgi:hypothetical protein
VAGRDFASRRPSGIDCEPGHPRQTYRGRLAVAERLAERLIGSIRRECVDHVIAPGEAHLRGILTVIALYLWASLPVTAVWLLGVLLGIQLICEGAPLGYLAWKVRAS